MAYFKTDRFVGRSYDLYGEYSLPEIDILTSLVDANSVALDVGANVGACTIPLAQKVGRGGLVLCWEPQRLVHQMLCTNLVLNQLSNTHAFMQGAADKHGTLFVPSVDYGAEGNFGAVTLQAETGAESVVVAPIDALNLSRCDLLKIDAEGMEKVVLTGAQNTIARLRPFLHVENDREGKSADLIAFLLELGYDVYWHLNSLFNPNNFFENSENVFGRLAAINLLGVPRERDVSVEGMFQAKHPESRWQDHIGPTDNIPPATVVRTG